MSKSIFQVRPQCTGKGWAIDEYDGRGAWQSTYSKNAKGEPLDKQEAQRRVFQLRRKALNSVKTGVPVNNPEVRRGGLYCTHPETTSAGWCPDCEQELNLLPVAEKSPNVAEKSPDETPAPICENCRHKAFLHTASGECMEWQCACERFEPEPTAVAAATRNVAPGDECSVCRGRHGSEVQHACE